MINNEDGLLPQGSDGSHGGQQPPSQLPLARNASPGEFLEVAIDPESSGNSFELIGGDEDSW